MSEMDELLGEFLIECNEIVDQLDRDLVALENNTSSEGLDRVFRALHTLKGSAAFLGFEKLEGHTHAGESLLSKVRAGELELTGSHVSCLLKLLDAVRRCLATVEATGEEGPFPEGLKERLEAMTKAEVEVEELPEVIAIADDESHGPEVAETSIRVDVVLLDQLMNLVGELVLARNQLLQHTVDRQDHQLAATGERMDLITTELQERVMKTRMQPIGNVWSRMPRIVRDTALSCGRQVKLLMDGGDTELDKTIIEAIKDPLTHVIRNAIDHGIESPEDRKKAGKPEEGLLQLSAVHEGGQVHIAITDDGKGIDLVKVRTRALERGIVSVERLNNMSDAEMRALIFAPGFSTAEVVTNVSGRGVGMDIVRTNIERIGGAIDIQSEPGRGTTFRLKIPLTLAIIPALVVRTAGDRYAIPQANLLELVRVEASVGGIEWIHGAPVYRLRGDLLPLVFLNEELGAERPDLAGTDVDIVVVQADTTRFGLVVDAIHDTEEIVVKPLGAGLGDISTFAGATIMGDGRVALILDVPSICRHSGVAESSAKALRTERASESAGDERVLQRLLLVGLDDRRLAIPLAQVARLEEIPLEKVERTGSTRVVQYRGGLLPLVDLARLSGGAEAPNPLPVVVCQQGDATVGIVVSTVEDIVEEYAELMQRAAPEGFVRATAVLAGRVTDVVDVETAIGMAGLPTFVVAASAA